MERPRMFPAAAGQVMAHAARCGLPGSHVRIDGAFDRNAQHAIGERLRRRNAGDRDLLACDVAGLVVDLCALDALAQLLLAVRRLGGELRLEGASEPLVELAALAGLDGVLRVGPSAVEAGREPEQGEQPRRVEEEDDAPDLSIGHVDDLQ